MYSQEKGRVWEGHIAQASTSLYSKALPVLLRMGEAEEKATTLMASVCMSTGRSQQQPRSKVWMLATEWMNERF